MVNLILLHTNESVIDLNIALWKPLNGSILSSSTLIEVTSCLIILSVLVASKYFRTSSFIILPLLPVPVTLDKFT